MDAIYLSKEDLVDYARGTLDMCDDFNIPPEEWTIAELAEYCIGDFGMLDGNCCEEGTGDAYVDGFQVVKDYVLTV